MTFKHFFPMVVRREVRVHGGKNEVSNEEMEMTCKEVSEDLESCVVI